MSGYLHRLAAQALGHGAAIRPLKPPRLDAGTVAEPDAAPTAADEMKFQPSSLSVAQDAPASGGPETVMPTVDAAATRPVSEPAAAPAPPPPRAKADPPTAPTACPAPPESHGRLLTVAETDRPRVAPADTAAAPPSRPAAADPAPRPPVRGVITTPLAAPRTTAVAPRGRAARHTVERTPVPDVHIHIGRIELTALTPAPAPRAVAAAAKRSTLDDYLRRTERKRP